MYEHLKRWGFLGSLFWIACSAGDHGIKRETQGAFATDLYLLMTDGNGNTTSWGPLASEDGRYYDIRPLASSDGVYEFLVQNQDQTLTFGYDRIAFDPEDEVAALPGTRNPDAFKIPLKGPHSYRFLFDTKNVSKPFLSVSRSQTLNSIEYKLMMQPRLFADPFPAIETLRDQLETLVKGNLGSDALTTSAKGAFEEALDTKLVYYYDTPRTCMFKRVGLIVRERKSHPSGDREFTLKVRGPNEAEVSQATVDTLYGIKEQKLEEEVSFAGNKDVYALKKSYSYSVDENVPKDQAMAVVDDFLTIYPNFYVNEDAPKLNPLDAIRPSVTEGLLEKVYVMGTVNLAGPSESAMLRKMEMTLWFPDTNAGSAPIVAELSFKMKEASGAFSKDSRTRSDLLFKAMNAMEYWVAPDGITKTNFAYGYDPSFCDK